MKESALYIIRKLKEHGFEGYLVGGCVRDMILKKIPNDWDICTSALPETVLEIFENEHIVFKKGIKHGTVAVVVDGVIFEITTYRIDKEYTDHRRPSEVEFTSELREDLKRRDFTINSMACGLEGEVIDYFSGMKDIENKVIRAVGNPYDRFDEDALRILRAVRFSVQLGFTIEKETAKAISEKKHLLVKISSDRKRDELNKMLLSEVPSRGIRLLVELNILEYIIPELEAGIGFEQKSPFHDKTIFGHTMDVLDGVEPILTLRLAALLHDIAKPITFTIDEKGIGHFYGHNAEGQRMASEIMKRLNYSKSDIEEVGKLVNYHMAIHDIQKKSSMKKLIRKIGEDTVRLLMKLYYADKKSTLDKENTALGERFQEIFDEVINSEEPMNMNAMNINGNDLMEIGFKPGPELGKVLQFLLDKIIEAPEKNDSEVLLEMAKKIKANGLGE